MPKFGVYAREYVFFYREIEAEDYEEAIEEFYTEGVPGLMFLNHEYPDEGEWKIYTVEDEDGKTVFQED